MAEQRHSDPLDGVERLAGIARREATPGVEVSAAVLRRLRSCEEPAAGRGLAYLTAGAIAAAAAVAVISMPYFSAAMDPLASLIESTATSFI